MICRTVDDGEYPGFTATTWGSCTASAQRGDPCPRGGSQPQEVVMAEGERDGGSGVDADGVTVHDVLDNLVRHFPGLGAQLCDDQGAVRKFINLYLNKEDIRFLHGEQTAVQDGDEIAIIPAVAGGQR